MNIFADEKISGKLLKKALPKISKATKQSKTPTQTRGSPDGKASREIGKRRRVPPTDEYATNAMIWAHSDKMAMGEQKLFYRAGKWVLLEKSDDGFVEMGTYSEKTEKYCF